ncbi:hypothetical protein B0J17DRAFT_262139 [Rhizoctonia solani]|nr:hypothetical protein B0J17DRAFT_262139 [Rhizoctonia solani]
MYLIGLGVSSTATPSSTSTPSSTPTPEPQTSSKVNIIVGVVLGAVGLILLIITTIFCVLRRRQRKWEENEGVNRPDSTFVIGKPATGGMTLQKDAANRYGPGGLFSPTTNDAFEKPRPIKTETALPDVLSDEHQQGKPEYAMPAPTPGYGNPGGGFGNFPAPQTQYSSVPNPGVAGVGAGGHGLQNEDRDSNVNTNRLTMRDGPQGAAAQMLAADIAAARAREGAFREDFSADGQGYQTSTDADGQSQFYRNGSMRQPFPTMPNPYGPSRNGNGNGKDLPLGHTARAIPKRRCMLSAQLTIHPYHSTPLQLTGTKITRLHSLAGLAPFLRDPGRSTKCLIARTAATVEPSLVHLSTRIRSAQTDGLQHLVAYLVNVQGIWPV